MNTKTRNISNTAPLLSLEAHVVNEEAVPPNGVNTSIQRALENAAEQRIPIILMVNVPNVPSQIEESGLVIISIHDEDPRPYIDSLFTTLK